MALTSAPPAFAVTKARDTVTIKLNDLGALGALNARLAAEKIPIRAVPVVAGCTAPAQAVGPHDPLGSHGGVALDELAGIRSCSRLTFAS
ncbi:MAG TPA: hypothetical protein VHV75_06300 [Solirubrobacteraceae bacterium]|nr:hypothetical protein [Solirubrobacteraceae bacterium]